MSQCYDFAATVAPGASVTKGLIYLKASSTVDFSLVELEITMDGGATQFWPKFEWLYAAGSFTAPTGGTTLTINKAGASSYNKAPAGVATALFGTFTAEIAAGSGTLTSRKSWYLPNYGGGEEQWPLGREPWYVQPSSALYLRVTTPASFANNIAIYGVVDEG